MGCVCSKVEHDDILALESGDDGDQDGGLLQEELLRMGIWRRATNRYTMSKGPARKRTMLGRFSVAATKKKVVPVAVPEAAVPEAAVPEAAPEAPRDAAPEDAGPAKVVETAMVVVDEAAALLREAEARARLAFAERWHVTVRVKVRERWLREAEGQHLTDMYSMDARTAKMMVARGHRHGYDSIIRAGRRLTRDDDPDRYVVADVVEAERPSRRVIAEPEGRRKGIQMRSKNWDRHTARQQSAKVQAGFERSRSRREMGSWRRRRDSDDAPSSSSESDAWGDRERSRRNAKAQPQTLREKLGLAAPKKAAWDGSHHVDRREAPVMPLPYRAGGLRRGSSLSRLGYEEDDESFLSESQLRQTASRREAAAPHAKATSKLRETLGIVEDWDHSFAFKTGPRPQLADVAARRGMDPEPPRRRGRGDFSPYGTLDAKRSESFRPFQERPGRKRSMRENADLAKKRRAEDADRRGRESARLVRTTSSRASWNTFERDFEGGRPSSRAGSLRRASTERSVVVVATPVASAVVATPAASFATPKGTLRTPSQVSFATPTPEASRARSSASRGRRPATPNPPEDADLLGRGSVSSATFDTTVDAARPRRRPESAPPRKSVKAQLADPDLPYRASFKRPKSATGGVPGMDVGPVVHHRKAKQLLRRI